MKRISIGLLCISLLAFNGCALKTEEVVEESTVVEETTEVIDETEMVDALISEPSEEIDESIEISTEENEVVAEAVEVIDYDLVKPNETGEVMVIMYHSLGEKNSAYVRTVESFKADLERLYAMDFRAISLQDYVNNNIDVPAGMTPVVFTFDDGHVSNFRMIEKEGEMIVDPDCTVGILEAFYQMHQDFGLEATFFLNGGTPFKQKEYMDYKMNYIVEKGMELGNHSAGHEHLPKLNADQIQKTLGGNIQFIESVVDNYEIKGLALPFGERPKDEYLNSLVTSGTYQGVAYKHNAILKVGWKPEVAAIHKKFNFEAINRVQSGDDDYQLSFYLDNYEKNPSKRFVSDGNPMTVTVPEERSETVDEARLGDMELITY